MGSTLTGKAIAHGETGVNFLSRFYGPDIWFGDNNSCCDVRRSLAKFHTTVSLPSTVTPLEKLLEKSRAYFLTDKNTPIIGELVSKAIELNGGLPEISKHSRMVKWNSDLTQDVQYPNEDSGWMESFVEEQLAELSFDSVTFRDALCKATLDSLLSMPLCAAPSSPATKEAVVLDEEVITPEKKEQTTEKGTNKPSRRGGKKAQKKRD
jgi:hypothetical protein